MASRRKGWGAVKPRKDELGCGEGRVETILLLAAEETWQLFPHSQRLGYGDRRAVGPARNLYASPTDRSGLRRIC